MTLVLPSAPILKSPEPGVFHFVNLGPGVVAGFSGREFSSLDRPAFLKQLNLNPSRLRLVRQIHGPEILVLKGEEDTESRTADGLLTASVLPVLGILTADCMPVFFSDPIKKVIGLVHAGWRGLHAGILSRNIRLMKMNFGCQPAALRVAFGPFIRACCYEVGEEFGSIFPGFFKRTEAKGKGRVDLTAVARDQLSGSGIDAGQISDPGLCTSCENGRFFSARRERTAERMLSVISLRPLGGDSRKSCVML